DGAGRKCVPKVSDISRGFGDHAVPLAMLCYQRFELGVGPGIEVEVPRGLPDVAARDPSQWQVRRCHALSPRLIPTADTGDMALLAAARFTAGFILLTETLRSAGEAHFSRGIGPSSPSHHVFRSRHSCLKTRTPAQGSGEALLFDRMLPQAL